MKSSQPHRPNPAKTDAQTVEAEIVSFEALSAEEEFERRRLEEIVERSFVEAGRALRQLRDGKLYRSTHSSFESYVRDRFAMRQSRSYQLIDAAEIFEHLSSKVPQFVELLPTNEAQCRPLTKLSSDEQVEVWQQAVSEAGGKVPPARVVKSVVDRIREQNPVPNPWRVGEIAELFVKANPDLYGRGGQWCIITEVHSFSCTVKLWDGKMQVKIENLKTLDLPPDQQQEVRRLCDRLNRLAQIEGLDKSVRRFLASLGEKTFLTPTEEKLLSVLEAEYAILKELDLN